MWRIISVKDNVTPPSAIWFSDGKPTNVLRGPEGSTVFLLNSNRGYLKIEDIGHRAGGPHYWALLINGDIYWYDGEGALQIVLNPGNVYEVMGDGNHLRGKLTSSPNVSDAELALFRKMMSLKLVPYQNIPDDPGRSVEEIKKIGKHFFPYAPYSFELAMSVYDWTTPCFFRVDMYSFFVYTGVAGLPLDLDSIAELIWTANWPPFTHENVDFMWSLMMKPAQTRDEVVSQLNAVHQQVRQFQLVEMNIIKQALWNLPRVSVQDVAVLYHGGPDISNMGMARFCAQFLELPGNVGPVSQPLQLDINQALDTILRNGSVLTTKGFWSYTDSESGAMKYSNGILVQVVPGEGAEYWPSAPYITPLSDGPEKTEYLFEPGCRFTVLGHQWLNNQGKQILLLKLQLLSTGLV